MSGNKYPRKRHCLVPAVKIHKGNVGKIIKSLLPENHTHNSKIAQSGLEILFGICDKMNKEEIREVLPTIIPPVINIYGNHNKMLQDMCLRVISKVIEKDMMSIEFIFEYSHKHFKGKNNSILEEIAKCLSSTIESGHKDDGVFYANLTNWHIILLKKTD